MMRRSLLLSLGLSLAFGSTSVAANRCAHIFARFELTAEIQKHIDATILDLAKFRVALDLAKVKGTNSVEFTALNANYIQKENEFVAYLEGHGIMTRLALTDKIKNKILEAQDLEVLEREKKSKEDARKLIDLTGISTIDGSRMVFHRMQPGSFFMGPPGSRKLVELTKPFEMMATQTTQLIWSKVAINAVLHLPSRLHSVVNPSSANGDLLPVESISMNNVKVWIESLNELSQTQEAIILGSVIDGHQKGDVYRLATEAEWEFVARDRGEYSGPAIPGELPTTEYAWINENSDGKTHPVATKKPLIVDGKPFYDLIGNVAELISDAWAVGSPPGGKDPHVVLPAAERKHGIVRGASWKNDESFDRVTVYRRQAVNDTMDTPDLGFRLVREVRP